MMSHLFYLTAIILLLLAVKGYHGAGTVPFKEVWYKLSYKDRVSKQISEGGDSLIIGSLVASKDEVKGVPNTVVTCTKLTDRDDYKEKHEPKVMNRTTTSYKKTEEETGVDIKALEYFIYLKKEIWSCEDAVTQLSFLRVKTELLGIKEIRSIHFNDGIDVRTQHYLGKKKTARIREIKYLLITDSMSDLTPIRYLGKVLEKPSENDFGIVDLSEKIVDRRLISNNRGCFREFLTQIKRKTTDKDGQQKEIIEEVAKETTRKISDSGIQLKVEYLYKENVLGTKISESICIQEQGVYPFPTKYRVDVKQVVEDGKLYKASISPEDYLNYFIPIREEIWTCKTEGKVFHRIVNEVIGRKPIKTLTHHQGVIYLYAIRLNGESLTARIREVRYFDAITNEEVKYEGLVKLGEKTILPPPKVDNKEIPYVLDDNRLFRTLISSEGYDIRVGERWEIVDTSTSAVECAFHPDIRYSRSYRTRFRLKIESNDELRTIQRIEALNKNKRPQFYEVRVTEVTLCSTEYGDEKFLRVFNEMEVLVPVHEIEFQEGIFVFEELLDANHKSVRIIEIKYLDIESKKVIKYEGTVKLVEDENKVSPAKLNDDNAIKVTEDDIFWSVGHFSEVSKDDRDFIPNTEITKVTQLKKKEQTANDYVLVFGSALKSTTESYGSATDTAECEKKETNKDQNLSLKFGAALLETNTEPGRTVLNNLKESFYVQFFNLIQQEKWSCLLPNGDSFLRIVEERTLKKDLPDAYKARICSYLCHYGCQRMNYKMYGDDNYLDINLIKYFKDEKKVPIKFDGYILLSGGKETQKKSGTIQYEEDKNEEKITTRIHYLTDETKYVVGRDWIYNSKINDAGDTLQIGRKWNKDIPDSEKITLSCKMVEDVDVGIFDTYYRTRIRKVGAKKEHNQHLFEQYFEIIKQEVWVCAAERTSVLRIMNHFSIKRNKCSSVKEMLYYDGVTILLGTNVNQVNEACTEIVEVKYLDPEDYSVLKFEGKVLLKGKDDTSMRNEITAKKLTKVAKYEVHYLPNKGEVHKTFIKDEGIIVEIGKPITDTFNHYRLMCTPHANVMPTLKEAYRPHILTNKLDDDKITQEKWGVEKFNECFIWSTTIFDCKAEDGGNLFTRVENILQMRKECPIATIFHYDGVVIDRMPTLTIKEIKFYRGEEKVNPVRVVGFVCLDEVESKAPPTEIKATREIDYKLDTETLHVKSIKDNSGPIIEIGQTYKKTFGSKNEAVLCTRVQDHTPDRNLGMKVYSNLKDKETNKDKVLMNEETMKKYFQLLRQELWTCKNNADKIKTSNDGFFRVVNVYLALKDISRIYYPDGILIGTQVFPDDQTAVQIKEIRYLDIHDGSAKFPPLKYEGKLTLEAIYSDKETSLFQMPSEYAEYQIDQSDPSEISAASVKYWPLDVLRIHAMRQKATGDLQGITYSETANQHPQTSIMDGAYGIKIEVGSKYEGDFTTEAGEMKCLLDEWNPTNKGKFLTKIRLHFDDDVYELDSVTIQEYFNIMKIEVWICVDNQGVAFLRVVTNLVGVREIYSVIHRDGVEVKSIDLENGGKSVDITETKYMDAKDFKILRYTGKLRSVEKVKRTVTEGGTANGGVASPFPTPSWRDYFSNKLTNMWDKFKNN